ncbi:histone acetyltransferase 1 [Brevipalpus obovatus]|uniref:histone acetyltransferase 1 n=1 Tax=Brevipalpus obovatus TaxID=246614 RepID=UPI003D9DF7A2
MNSRLDRLFLLLDQGTSPVTRRAAAAQLGEVQRLHPHELNNLLAKVRGYLQSTCWETRVAASQAVEAIIKQIPEWPPQDECEKGDRSSSGRSDNHSSGINCDDDEECSGSEGRMSFNVFDVIKVIECGKDLLGSEGTEYDVNLLNGDNIKASSLKEKLSVQRQLLNKKLGLDLSQKLDLGLNSDDLVSNEDLESEAQPADNCKKIRLGDLLESNSSNDRKRKNVNGSREGEKRIKLENDKSVDGDSSDNNNSKVIDLNNLHEWPLQSFCDQLTGDLFNAQWEIRHGAATGLREIVKIHGRSAGRILGITKNEANKLNQLWLEDLALRLICVLALDKFGDFVSDQVVAPVRETCAQTLGSVFNIMSSERIYLAVDIILRLLSRPEWETRHGGSLAIKYLLAIRTDLASILLPKVFDSVFKALKDAVDDVSAVAASALVPVRDFLIENLSDKVPSVIEFLWDALLEIDELTSSTSDILKLLSSLLVKYHNYSPSVLRDLVPRLWPFLGHSLSSVRRSVIESLLVLSSNDLSWLDMGTLSDSLRLLYQRCLTETCPEIIDLLHQCWSQLVSRCDSSELIPASCPHLSGWICLMMHPAKNPIDVNVYTVWLVPKRRPGVQSDHLSNRECEKPYLGGFESLNDSPSQRDKYVIRARLQAASFIGMLAERLSKLEDEQNSTFECFVNLLLFHLNTKSAIQRTCVAWIIKEWSAARRKANCDSSDLPKILVDKCVECLQENIHYDEQALSLNRLQQEALDYIASLKHHKIPLPDEFCFSPLSTLTPQLVTNLVSVKLTSELIKPKPKPKVMESLEDRRRALSSAIEEFSRYQVSLSVMVSSSLSSCLISWEILPDKLNPIIRPLMDTIKTENNEELQQSAAYHLALLLDLCLKNERSDKSVAKIINNLVSFLCSDPNYTPNLYKTTNLLANQSMAKSEPRSGSSSPTTSPILSLTNGIISLNNMCKMSEKHNLKRLNSSNSMKKSLDSCDDSNLELAEEYEKLNESIRKGASFALASIVQHFGDNVTSKLPQLWEYLTRIQILSDSFSHELEIEKSQELINSLQVLETISLHLHKSLHQNLIEILPVLSKCLDSHLCAVRHLSARCLGILSTIILPQTMDLLLCDILNLLGSSDDEYKRQGAIEAIFCIIEKLGIEIVPYIVLLIIPMLGRMSDQNDQVRLLATHCFAQLVQLMPLDNNKIDSNLDIREELIVRKQHEKHFLEQLINPKKLDDFKLPVPVKAELRSYQQEGVNWLSFLNRYKLHGILCDEMGLGKTLMSICILASDHYLRSEKYAKTKAVDAKPLPSLVVCPPTLTGHWVYEVEKFIDQKYLCPLHYTGPPLERAKLRKKLKTGLIKTAYNLVIASYDIVRNDIDFFSSISWNYCILDEGHIIKNGKTKLSKAIKSICANHRLILSGTPIQNNVLELWSLFDFLIPGFLGTERQFSIRYSKPILQSRDAKSSKEQESGVLAMESLHRQSLPFILRRMKEDVLNDLPPKIMQDYYCELSELQSKLYEDFARSRARKNLEDTVQSLDEVCEKSKDNKGSSNIFQALQYLRKVCNHPKLVLTPQHPQYVAIINRLKEQNSSLDDINHAAKLCALKQLLLDCGIGAQSASLVNGTEPVVNQHRALIFCQLKSMLDIVENNLLRIHLPSVSYLRLDGSIPPGSRQSLVYRFNNDPSIDVLLLTTQVGGLGLNLTGADTVIFVEHDWNPMKDLQAMDRAHRIGQKKVVNVYRLITKGTLEEKIMGLQKFKLTIANSVISTENSTLQTMGTDQLLDLFCLDAGNIENNQNKSTKNDTKGGSVKSVLESLPELWDADQYDSEYDLTAFIQSLKS